MKTVSSYRASSKFLNNYESELVVRTSGAIGSAFDSSACGFVKKFSSCGIERLSVVRIPPRPCSSFR